MQALANNFPKLMEHPNIPTKPNKMVAAVPSGFCVSGLLVFVCIYIYGSYLLLKPNEYKRTDAGSLYTL